ncbi:MAG: tetratricopeptide repeat protein [Deltaproteobacteria bacterium]|nr:tetratricopeptide repeat protein [Deltaproteobacteria bacterium]
MRAALVILAVFAVYLNALLYGSFQFDDFNVIVNNPAVHSLDAWRAGLFSGIRPLLKLTYAANWSLSGSPFGFHFFNIAVHAASALLVLRLSETFMEKNGVGKGFALFSALLFALHPIQTEAVTYVSGRSSSLMAFFLFASLFLYEKGRDKRPALAYIASSFFFLLAVGVKETAVIFPFALILWDKAMGRGLRDSFKRQAAHWGLFLFAVLAILGSRGYNRFFTGIDARELSSTVLSNINGVAYLLSRFVSVKGLNIDPDLPVLTASSPLVPIEAAALAVLVIGGILLLVRRPWAGFGVLWLFLFLLPTNSIVPRLDIANERHLYIGAFGVFLSFSVGVSRVAGKLDKRAVAAVGAVFLLILGAFTVARNRDYRSETSLWEATVKLSPAKPRAWNNLGFAYSAEGRKEEARAAYSAALRLDPGYGKAERNLKALGD